MDSWRNHTVGCTVISCCIYLDVLFFSRSGFICVVVFVDSTWHRFSFHCFPVIVNVQH